MKQGPRSQFRVMPVLRSYYIAVSAAALLKDTGNETGGHGPATLPDGDAHTSL